MERTLDDLPPSVPLVFPKMIREMLLAVASLQALFSMVGGQCSEAQRVACSLPYLVLKLETKRIQFSGDLMPDFNSTTLHRTCRLYEVYRKCTIPYLDTCQRSTIVESRLLDAILGELCSGAHYYDYVNNVACFRRIGSLYDVCKKALGRTLKSASSENGDAVCDATNRYVGCVTQTTLHMCGWTASDLYFHVLNQTFGLLLEDKSDCVITDSRTHENTSSGKPWPASLSSAQRRRLIPSTTSTGEGLSTESSEPRSRPVFLSCLVNLWWTYVAFIS